MTKGPGYYDNTGDAKSIQGIDVSSTPPTSGQGLFFNAINNRYEPSASAGGSGGGGGSSGGGADPGATYLLVSTTGSLANQRTFAVSSGLTKADGGAGSTLTVGIDSNVVATISGSTFTKLSGSLQQTSTGLSYLFGNADVSVVTQSNGQVALALVIPGSNGNPLFNLNGHLSNAGNFVFTNGNLQAVAPGSFTGSFTGSIQQVAPGFSFLVGGRGILVSSATNGQVTHLLDNNVAATISGSTFTGPLGSTGGITGSMLMQKGGIPFDYDSTGAGTLNIVHSGSWIDRYDSLFRVHDLKGRWQTTGSGVVTGLQFISGANGRTYGVDAMLTCQHITTVESGRWKLSGHARMTGGSMAWIATDTALTSSNVFNGGVSGTLGLSAGNIVVQSTQPSSGTFNWGASLRVQELG